MKSGNKPEWLLIINSIIQVASLTLHFKQLTLRCTQPDSESLYLLGHSDDSWLLFVYHLSQSADATVLLLSFNLKKLALALKLLKLTLELWPFLFGGDPMLSYFLFQLLELLSHKEVVFLKLNFFLWGSFRNNFLFDRLGLFKGYLAGWNNCSLLGTSCNSRCDFLSSSERDLLHRSFLVFNFISVTPHIHPLNYYLRLTPHLLLLNNQDALIRSKDRHQIILLLLLVV
jgi:hypothetical protein